MAELSINVEGLEQVKEYLQKTEKCLSDVEELRNKSQYVFSLVMEQLKKIQMELEQQINRDQFIKLTGGRSGSPIYVKSISISGLKRIDDAIPYTEVAIAGGDIYRVSETPETIMESLGYQKGGL